MRGRPREFDRDKVLDTVIQLFWDNGYQATSVSDIVEATGLNKSSLCNAFGSKDHVFDLALDRYVEARTTIFEEVLVQGAQGLDAIQLLLDTMWSEATVNCEHRGCQAVNSSSELGVRDSTAAYRRSGRRR